VRDMLKLCNDLYNANLECGSNPKSHGNPSAFRMLSVPTSQVDVYLAKDSST
jgi:hypothetical protein